VHTSGHPTNVSELLPVVIAQRQSRRPIPRQTRAAGSGAAPSGRRLDQPGQRHAHRVVEIGVGEAAVQTGGFTR